jgi:hypothetical protein
MRTVLALLVAAPLAAAAQPTEPPQQYPPQQYPPAPQQYPPGPQQHPPPPGQYAPPAKQRGSWYIGFGLGGGDGTVKLDGRSVDFDDMVYSGSTPLAFNLRLGATVSPKLLVGFDGGFVGASSDSGGYASTIQLNYYDVGVMYFPAERGLYLRGAAGLSGIVWDVEPLGRSSARGFNVVGGIGYAFWIGRTFNLTLNLDASRHWFSEEGLDGGTSWSGWLGFDWY